MDHSPRAFRRTKYTCYYTYLAMSAIFVLPPMLFTAFHRLYGISYTLLGTLVLINFCIQMAVDLFFSFFPRVLPTRVIVRIMPFLTTFGLLLYALLPMLVPHAAYGGLVAGTAVFSLASGLNEVVLSPTDISQSHACSHSQSIDAGRNTHQREHHETKRRRRSRFLLLSLPGLKNNIATQRTENDQHNPRSPGIHHRAHGIATPVSQQRHSCLKHTHRERQPESSPRALLPKHQPIRERIHGGIHREDKGNNDELEVIHARAS